MSGDGPLVIKVGGSTLGAADTAFRDIAALDRDGARPIVVHGGGAEASRWLEAMGIESRFIDGLRATDERALPVIVAVFAGLVNKTIVAALNAAGARAAGLSGADGRTLECEMRRPELGYVGTPVAAHPEAVLALRDAGFTPVVSPVGFVPPDDGEDGDDGADGDQLDQLDQLVNVNADEAAGWIARAVDARELVFLTDVEGVRGADGAVIPELDAGAVRDLRERGVIAGGMIPKTDACLLAAALGVPSRIIDGRASGALLDRDARGTVFPPASP